MKKHLLLVSALLACLGTAPVMGQQAYRAIRGTNEAATRRLSLEVKQRQEANYQRALDLAKKHGWVINQSFVDGSSMALKGVDERGLPMYDITYSNANAAATTATSPLWPGGTSGLNLSGSSAALHGKLGVFDEPVLLTHQELVGRVVQVDAPQTPGSHGTHVSGTMIASGVNPLAKGMAFGAQQLRAWNFQGPATTNMATHAASLLISNHSYGSIAGWRNNTSRAGTATDPRWEWWGDLDLTPPNTANPATDWKFGFYNTEAQTWDQIAYNAPYYLIVKSAGNNRSQAGPEVGAPFMKRNANGTFTLVTSRPEGISSNTGYDIISTYGNSKNILTVGAVNALPNGYRLASEVQISTFSSWGPTDDGRIKPDIVGNGVGLLSSNNSANDAYSTSNGTSMSAPNVSGSMFLLQEHYSNLHNGDFMKAATLKGLVLHTADEAGRPGPDYVYGWGLLNTERAAKVISERGTRHIMEENSLEQGNTYSFQVTASGAGPLVATISWTDPEGTVHALTPENVNNRTPKLINDLDIRISDGSTTYNPWVLNPDQPNADASTGDNIRDNVEQVLVASAVPGKTYTVTVSHKGTLQRGPQAYSLIVSGIGGTAYCHSGARFDSDSRIDGVSFGTLNNISNSGCTTYRDFTHMTAGLQLGQTLPLTVTLGTCFGQESKIVKTFIDWNGDGDFDDEGELISTSGVLTTETNFTTTLRIPQTLTDGNITRMRVVLVETSNPNEVTACGTYAKGETQDYRVLFQKTSTDVGVTAYLTPESVCAGTSFSSATVMLKNFGAASQSNIPVQITVKDGENVISTSTSTYEKALAAYSEAEFKVTFTPLTALAGKTLTIEATTLLANDMEESNNGFSANVPVTNPAAAPTVSALACGTASVALMGSSEGTIYWYDSPTGGTFLGAGNQINPQLQTENNTYYAAVNEFRGKIGPVTKEEFTDGGYNQFGPSINFTAHAPFIIKNARLYIGNSGTLSFIVRTLTGQEVSRVTLDVTATRTTSGTGAAQPNDPDDTGAVYDLDLKVPAAGNYLIAIEYGGGATTYRNNTGVTGYPFTIPGVMSITGNTAAGPLNFYYYLYDIEVEAYGCASTGRTAVTATPTTDVMATITPEGATEFCDGNSVVLSATAGSGLTYQWYRNGVAIAGATDVNYTAAKVATTLLTAKETSLYSVVVSNAAGCTKLSEELEVEIHPASPATYLISSSTTQLCEGTEASVVLRAVTGINASLVTFKWFKDGEEIEEATEANYTATSAGTYKVEVTREPCGAATAEIVISIENAALALTKTEVQLCGLGSSTELTASANTGHIFWYDAASGGNMVGVGPSFTTPALTESKNFYAGVNDFVGSVAAPSKTSGGAFSSFTGGRMYFDAEMPFIIEKVTMNVSAAGTEGARTATIIIVDKNFSSTIIASRTIALEPGIREYDVNLFVPAAGSNYGFQVSAFGGGATAYRNNTAGSSNYPYTIPGVVAITGNNQSVPSSWYYFGYDWKVKATGCATTERQKVEVEVLPLPTATMSGSTEICEGAATTVSVTLTGTAPWILTYTDGTTPVVVEGLNENSYTFSTSTTNTFRLVSITDAKATCNTGLISGEAAIVVNPVPAKPTIAANKATTQCIGDSITITGPEGFAAYKWSNGDTTSSIVVGRSGTYSLQVSNGKCDSEASEAITVRFITVPSTPTVSVQGETTFCEGGSTLLVAPSGFSSYRWSTGETTETITVSTTGNYTVVVGNGNCESEASASKNITVVAAPAKPTITASGNVIRSSSATGNQWMLNGEAIEGATADSLVITTSGRYSVVVYNGTCFSPISTESEIWATSVMTPLDARLSLYPNPVSNLLTVELVDADATNTMTAKIYNIQGIEVTTLVFEREGSLQKASVNVAQYASGVYVVKFISNSNVKTLRFVKQ